MKSFFTSSERGNVEEQTHNRWNFTSGQWQEKRVLLSKPQKALSFR